MGHCWLVQQCCPDYDRFYKLARRGKYAIPIPSQGRSLVFAEAESIMKKPQFRLSTVFWLVTTSALLLGWYKDHRKLVADQQKLAQEMAELKWDNTVLAGLAREGITGGRGIRWTPPELSPMRNIAIARVKRRLVEQGTSPEQAERELQWVTEYLRSYYEYRRRIEAKGPADETAGTANEWETQ
jgi:hypothetical protein